ncbi:MAG: hypothetical protein JWN44_811 [Myxococcales bacterium]|nr:hypothetical protein [Myxococcales bacterium]
MKFFTFFHPAKPMVPSEQHLADMAKLTEESTKAGILLATGALHPSSKGLKIRRSGQEYTVTDGPFAEAKELILGYAMLEVKSKQQLIDVVKRFLEVAGDGESEVWQVYDGPPPAAK